MRRQQLTVRRRARLLSLVIVMLVLSACGEPAERDQTLSFEECPAAIAAQVAARASMAGGIDIECGRLAVPLDHAQPEGEQITLQVIRVRHREQTDRIGTLVFHPGGPGDPGVSYTPTLLSWLPESLLKRFDLVTLDPRGTDGSAPVNCPDPPTGSASAKPSVLTEAGFAQALSTDRQRSQACLQALGARAPHFSTQAAAHDLDRLRAAVGDEALTYLGLSYAAKLGAEYAHRFPNSVRAAVLDGPSTPSEAEFENVPRYTRGFEESFDQYAADCPTRPTCLFDDPRAVAIRLVARADATPIPSTRGGDEPADGLDVLEGVHSALYDDALWPELDRILYQASEAGDSAGLRAMREELYGPPVEDTEPADSEDARYVINCNDSAPGPTDDQIRAVARSMARDFPLFGVHNAQYLFECKTWQPVRSALEPPVAATSNRLLVVGTVHDTVTPYSGAVALTGILGNATLLTWEGNNHTATGYSSCIADFVASYLIDLTLPADGTRCPA